MSNEKVEKLYNRIYSVPIGKARNKLVEALSSEELDALSQFTRDVASGRAKPPKSIKAQENAMSYETFRQLSDGDESGAMRKLSAFALESPTRYNEYRERLQGERDEMLRLHNRKVCGY